MKTGWLWNCARAPILVVIASPRLLQALAVLFDSNQGNKVLERRLAGALFGIAYSIQTITGTPTPSKSWSKQFMNVERDQICSAVESIFYDQWITPDM